ncbi:MAG: TraB/GumN family protein [Chitinophagales bacterium]
MKSLIAVCTLLFILPGCKTPHATQSTNKLQPVKLDAPLSTDKSLLWQISGNGLKQASYLFGTIHLIDQDRYFLGKNTLKKLQKSQELIMELDMENIDVLELAKSSILEKGTTVKNYMSDSDYVVLQQFMEDSIGITKYNFENGYAKFKPFYLEQLLFTKYMGQRNESYEINLKKIAQDKNIPVSGLETYDEQLKFLDEIPLETQLKSLITTIKNYKAETEELEKLIHLYTQQDLPGLSKAFEEEQDRNLLEKLLDKRNKNWVPQIMELIQEKACFFAVGAGHLGGDHGIIQLLQDRGYTVQPVSAD